MPLLLCVGRKQANGLPYLRVGRELAAKKPKVGKLKGAEFLEGR